MSTKLFVKQQNKKVSLILLFVEAVVFVSLGYVLVKGNILSNIGVINAKNPTTSPVKPEKPDKPVTPPGKDKPTPTPSPVTPPCK